MKATVISAAAIVAAFGTAAARPAQTPTCVRYAPDTVRVSGILQRRVFYGEPGYGDDPRHDAKESGFYLKLASPMCMAAGGDEVDAPKQGVRLVQVLLEKPGYEALRPYLGKRITLRGTLSGAITGHHHAPVLLEPVQPVHVER